MLTRESYLVDAYKRFLPAVLRLDVVAPATVDDATVSYNHHAVDVHRVTGGLLEEAVHGLRHAVRGFSTRAAKKVFLIFIKPLFSLIVGNFYN